MVLRYQDATDLAKKRASSAAAAFRVSRLFSIRFSLVLVVGLAVAFRGVAAAAVGERLIEGAMGKRKQDYYYPIIELCSLARPERIKHDPTL